jgi:hypothetical protein
VGALRRLGLVLLLPDPGRGADRALIGPTERMSRARPPGTGIRRSLAFAGPRARGAQVAWADWRRSAGGPAVLAALATLALVAAVAVGPGQQPLNSSTDGSAASGLAEQVSRTAIPSQGVAPVAKAAGEGSAPVSATARRRARDAYQKLPLSFVPNAGQTNRSVRYYAQGNGFGFYFTPDKTVLSFTKGGKGAALHLIPLRASASAKLEADQRGPGRVNYLVGSKRHTNLPTYQEIAYRELWPGIDMVFRGQGGKLKYEFRLAPGADPSRIRLAYRGAEGLSLGAAGNLLISTPLGTLRDARPRSYQRVGAERVAVESRYVVDEGANVFGLAVGGSYDRRRPLVIDPGLAYSTYLGGALTESSSDIAVDAAGSAYVTGGSQSSDYPTTAGAFDQTHASARDAFVTKLNPTGSALVYSTYIGGSASEGGLGITVDATGSAYVSGGTGSSDFPATSGAFDVSHNGNEDVWVAKLNASGSTLLYSTFLGGSSPEGDFGAAIAVDGDGSAYVAGGAGPAGFPTTAGALDESHNGALDVFVAKLNATGTALAYSTYLGGTAHEAATGIVLDAAGRAHVSGNTASPEFPTTAGGFDMGHNGGFDAFVAKLDPTGGPPLAYSTFLGGASEDVGQGIALDYDGDTYTTGWTRSTDFPTTTGALDESYNGGLDLFVTKLEVTGAAPLAYSTYLGGALDDRGFGIALDSLGSAYVTGSTASSDFPTTTGAFDESHNGGLDAFVTKLNAAGSFPLAYSTYLGGASVEDARAIALDGSGSAYVTGRVESSDFPTTPGALDSSLTGARDVFVTKVVPVGAAAEADHYVCYTATDLTANDPGPVLVRDQFESGQFDPGKADRLCSPAQKNDEPVHDSATYLKRYPIAGVPFRPKSVLVTNQFGQFVIEVTGPRFLLVPTSRDDPDPPDPGAPGFEHYKCYVFNKQPTVTDQFQTRTIAVVAWGLCNPAQKNDEAIRDPNRHLLCYQISGPAPVPNEVDAVNQFGTERLRLGIKRQFCLPSVKEVQPL